MYSHARMLLLLPPTPPVSPLSFLFLLLSPLPPDFPSLSGSFLSFSCSLSFFLLLILSPFSLFHCSTLTLPPPYLFYSPPSCSNSTSTSYSTTITSITTSHYPPPPSLPHSFPLPTSHISLSPPHLHLPPRCPAGAAPLLLSLLSHERALE